MYTYIRARSLSIRVHLQLHYIQWHTIYYYTPAHVSTVYVCVYRAGQRFCVPQKTRKIDVTLRFTLYTLSYTRSIQQSHNRQIHADIPRMNRRKSSTTLLYYCSYRIIIKANAYTLKRVLFLVSDLPF